jgi:hypothetical protein
MTVKIIHRLGKKNQNKSTKHIICVYLRPSAFNDVSVGYNGNLFVGAGSQIWSKINQHINKPALTPKFFRFFTPSRNFDGALRCATTHPTVGF